MFFLQTLLMMFYAPVRAMRDVRDRAPLLRAALTALIASSIYTFYVQAPFLLTRFSFANPRLLLAFSGIVFASAQTLLFVLIIFVPILVFVANLFERRGSFRLALASEYSAAASVMLYAWATASLAALPVFALMRVGGFEADVITQALGRAAEWQRTLPQEMVLPPLDAQLMSQSLALMLMLLLFAPWALVAAREAFRFHWGRTVATLVLSLIVVYPAAIILAPLFAWVFASPFLLIILYLFLRGYFGELADTQRARLSFKRNLEAATLNPADASAHYNLGLIHFDRKELPEARARFERAIEIDPDEQDAHYQLGRIARLESRYPDAVAHFEQVVRRNESHAQYEIWREIGATYLAAGQAEDARAALERFLEHRTTDAEGLYLMGRALAGLGRLREASEAMRRCIEAVKSAPAYKYRAEKRWLNEAQNFLRSQQA